MLWLERLLRDEADHAELAKRRCRMFQDPKGKTSMGLPAASVSFAETPVTLSNGGNCSVIA